MRSNVFKVESDYDAAFHTDITFCKNVRKKLNERDEIKSFTVTRVEDGLLTIDGNSPLVGKKLRFKLTIHDIRDATEKEVNNGRPFMRSLH